MNDQEMFDKFRDSAIEVFPFSEEGVQFLKYSTDFGENWPVVYLLSGKGEMYIGESSNACQRMKNHLANENRAGLDTMRIVFNPRFNKSVILDLEATLIAMLKADQNYKLQNSNSGQKMSHNYYQQDLYRRATFPHIWELLKREHLVKHSYEEIRNSDLFKFSPYHTLSEEQYETASEIIDSLIGNYIEWQKKEKTELHPANLNSLPSYSNPGKTFFVQGAPGTGKTILAIYLIKTIRELFNGKSDQKDLEDIPFYHQLAAIRHQKFKIGFVIPQTSLRETLRKVFRENEELDPKMILGPNDVSKENYDLLIVDESHRLNRRKQITSYGAYDKVNQMLNLPRETSQLQWILRQSTYQILIYDSGQSVRDSDVEAAEFEALKHSSRSEIYTLNSQMRAEGGKDYIDYISRLFSDTPPAKFQDFGPIYEFKLFDSVSDLVNTVHQLDYKYGLSRVLAGYAYPWKTKGRIDYTKADADAEELWDFSIQGKKFVWNTVAKDWINSDHACDEVGCIHTVQGYDLNYAGVIIGPDVTYNPHLGKIEFHPEHYFDKKNKTMDPESMKRAALSAYKVMLTRGIKGTFVYAADPEMQNYLKKYIQTY